MFFVGIMGIGNKEKTITELSDITCKSCQKYGRYTVLKRYSYFHLFFIPIWKWGFQYYVVERTCNTIFRLSEQAGREIERGAKKEILDDELVEHHYVRRCKKCGQVLDDEFIYCPYCGVGSNNNE